MPCGRDRLPRAKFDGGIITRHDSVVFGIVAHTSTPSASMTKGEDIWTKRYAIWGRLVAAQPDQIAYSFSILLL